jgi:hypothetical protein
LWFNEQSEPSYGIPGFDAKTDGLTSFCLLTEKDFMAANCIFEEYVETDPATNMYPYTFYNPSSKVGTKNVSDY